VTNTINALEPIAAELIGRLRHSPDETDEQVIARAKAKVAETDAITKQDMTDDEELDPPVAQTDHNPPAPNN